MRRTGVTALIAAVLLAATACTSDSGPPDALPTVPTPTLSPCPSPNARPKPIVWPAGIPEDVPKPPMGTLYRKQKSESGLSIAYIRTPTAFRDGVLFVLQEFPKAGYVLGRGDAEAVEADAPFQRGALRGIVKLLATAPCVTTWLVAVGSAAGPSGGPVIPGYSARPTASALPFG